MYGFCTNVAAQDLSNGVKKKLHSVKNHRTSYCPGESDGSWSRGGQWGHEPVSSQYERWDSGSPKSIDRFYDMLLDSNLDKYQAHSV